MKPIGIFRHSRTEGPGYFATYLERSGLRWRLIGIDRNEPVPEDPSRFSGIAFMGGPMSVNDRLPWIDPVLHLIRRAVHADIPVIGHCLGGQLMSRALGGVVTPSETKEIGWGDIQVAATPEAKRWFGRSVERFLAFHWHGETFSLPPNAHLLASSPRCAHQAFSLGKHLALQCHVEMTAELIESWCSTGAAEIEESSGPAVQSCAEMERHLDVRLADLHAVADRLYARWIEGLAR